MTENDIEGGIGKGHVGVIRSHDDDIDNILNTCCRVLVTLHTTRQIFTAFETFTLSSANQNIINSCCCCCCGLAKVYNINR